MGLLDLALLVLSDVVLLTFSDLVLLTLSDLVLLALSVLVLLALHCCWHCYIWCCQHCLFWCCWLVCCCNTDYQCQDPTSTTRLPATDSWHQPGQSCLSLPSSWLAWTMKLTVSSLVMLQWTIPLNRHEAARTSLPSPANALHISMYPCQQVNRTCIIMPKWTQSMPL